MNEFVSKSLPLFISSFAVAVALAYLSRKAKSAPDDGRLVFGPEIKVTGWAVIAIAVGILIAMFTLDHGGQYVAMIILTLMFGCLGLWLLLEGYWTKGGFDDFQITMSSFWKSPRTSKWIDLQEVAFKKNGQYFKLTFKDGTQIGFSKLMHGHRSACDHIDSLGIDITDRPKD